MVNCCSKDCQEETMEFVGSQNKKKKKLRRKNELVYFQPGNMSH